MKVLTRTEFLALKGPVLYSKWYADFVEAVTGIKVEKPIEPESNLPS